MFFTHLTKVLKLRALQFSWNEK